MIIRCNLGTPSQWFILNAKSATADLNEDLRNRNISQRKATAYLSAMIGNNPKLQALILGFDYFGNDLMSLVSRCLWTGITVKLCDQSNKQIDQFAPLGFFPRGSLQYEKWQTVDYPNTQTARTYAQLRQWQRENVSAYMQRSQIDQLRQVLDLCAPLYRELIDHPDTLSNASRYITAYHRAGDLDYSVATPGTEDWFQIFEELYELYLTGQEPTPEERYLNRLQILYYLRNSIPPTRTVTQLVDLELPSWISWRFQSEGSVIPDLA